MSNKEQYHECIICGAGFYGWGHNPAPVKMSGRCCGYCNSMVVIPARLTIMLDGRRQTA